MLSCTLGFGKHNAVQLYLPQSRFLLVLQEKQMNVAPLITAPAGSSVHQAAVTMAMKHIRRLPITSNGKLVGIITARDLVEAYAK
jgi:CBS domain-containing protein